jgi:hypothetical protein
VFAYEKENRDVEVYWSWVRRFLLIDWLWKTRLANGRISETDWRARKTDKP